MIRSPRLVGGLFKSTVFVLALVGVLAIAPMAQADAISDTEIKVKDAWERALKDAPESNPYLSHEFQRRYGPAVYTVSCSRGWWSGKVGCRVHGTLSPR